MPDPIPVFINRAGGAAAAAGDDLAAQVADAFAAAGATADVHLVKPDEIAGAVAKAASTAKRLVVGHTPSLNGIIISPDNKLARIDTGNSRYYGGTLSWLEIVGDRMIPHTTPRTP